MLLNLNIHFFALAFLQEGLFLSLVPLRVIGQASLLFYAGTETFIIGVFTALIAYLIGYLIHLYLN